MGEPLITSRDRILGLFPHPDDESLGAGILLQQASKAGASLRLVFLTSGEGNAWPQRVLDRKLFLTDEDRRRFALRRKQEVARALETLGLPETAATFLDLPDTGLASLLIARGETLLQRVEPVVEEFRPTLVLAPLLADRHPDHNAAAVLACALQARWGFRLWAYATHAAIAPGVEGVTVAGTPQEQQAKGAAIAAHRSQLVFRRRFHMGFARLPDRFFPITAPPPRSRVEACLRGQKLEVAFTLAPGLRSFRAPILTVVTLDEKLLGFKVGLGRNRGALPLGAEWERLELAFQRHRGLVALRLPAPPLLAFVKVSRPLFLYEEAGFVSVCAA